MTKFTSLIPPGFPVPDPPDPIKVVGAVLSVFLSALLIGFIVFLCVEFALDQIGKPIRGDSSSTADVDSNDEDEPPLQRRLFTAEEIQAQFRVVTPPDHARIEGKGITVLCRWTPPGPGFDDPPVQPQLFLDDVFIPWTMRFGANTWFAHIEAGSGEHQLRVLNQDLTVFVFDSVSFSGVTKSQKQLIVHEGTDDSTRCGECHVIIDGKNDIVHKSRGLTIGPLRPPEACFGCHKNEATDQRHAKLAEPPGNDCATCHQLHGKIPADR